MYSCKQQVQNQKELLKKEKKIQKSIEDAFLLSRLLQESIESDKEIHSMQSYSSI